MQAGVGVGLVSRWAVAPAIARREIVALRLTKVGLLEHWFVVYRRDSSVRAPLERFATLLADALAPTIAGQCRRAPRPATRRRESTPVASRAARQKPRAG
jgi:LysR family transcriptional regulator for metE and metH